MSVKLQKPAFDTLLQVANGGITAESPALQDGEQLSRFKSVAIVEFNTHWFPLKGNREVIRDSPYRKPEVLKRTRMNSMLASTSSFVHAFFKRSAQTDAEYGCGEGNSTTDCGECCRAFVSSVWYYS